MNDVEQKNSAFLAVVDASEIGEMTWPSRIIFVLLCALPMITTLLYGGVDTIFLPVLSLTSAVIIVLWIMDAWSLGELRFSTNLLQLPIIGLLVLGVIQLLPLGDPGLDGEALSIAPSHALSLDQFSTRLFVIRLIAYIIFFGAALAFINSQGRTKKLVLSIVIFGSVLAFFGALLRLANTEGIYGIRPTPQAIPFGPFVNQHHFAAFMEMTSGVTLAMLFGGGLKRDRKPFLIIAAVLMGIAIVFTGSRGGVLSYAGVVAFVVSATYIFHGKAGQAESGGATGRFSIVAGAVAIGLIVIGLGFYLGGGDALLRGIGAGEGYVDITSGRIYFWGVALKIFASHPILGSGLDSFGVAFSQFDPRNGLFRVEQAHNDYLQVLSDGGIIGFACVAAFVVLLFRNGMKTIASSGDELGRSIAIGALGGCFGIAIHSFFDFPLRTPSNALFFLLLAVLATTRFRSE